MRPGQSENGTRAIIVLDLGPRLTSWLVGWFDGIMGGKSASSDKESACLSSLGFRGNFQIYRFGCSVQENI